MGLMIAWCDNDGSELRENFIGSESAPGENKDRGWIDAGCSVRSCSSSDALALGSTFSVVSARRPKLLKQLLWGSIDVEQAPVFFRPKRSIRIALPWLVERLEEEHGRIGARAPISPARDSSAPGRLIGSIAKLARDGRPARFENCEGLSGSAARTPSMFSIVYASASSIVLPSHSG